MFCNYPLYKSAVDIDIDNASGNIVVMCCDVNDFLQWQRRWYGEDYDIKTRRVCLTSLNQLTTTSQRVHRSSTSLRWTTTSSVAAAATAADAGWFERQTTDAWNVDQFLFQKLLSWHVNCCCLGLQCRSSSQSSDERLRIASSDAYETRGLRKFWPDCEEV